MSAFSAGFEAGFNGYPFNSNPYSSMDPNFDAWDQGHAAGEGEARACEEDCLADEDSELDDYDDSMDGDFDSGMASAGFGTDEDYSFGCHDGWGDE